MSDIDKLLKKIKDTKRDYVGINGCLYQDLTREELNLIIKEIDRIDKAIERLEELQNEIFDGTRGNKVRNIIDILKGRDTNE